MLDRIRKMGFWVSDFVSVNFRQEKKEFLVEIGGFLEWASILRVEGEGKFGFC